MARCIEKLVWEDGANLLGSGGRIVLDGDTGNTGCRFGVRFNTGWFYPCQKKWQFFNLQGSVAKISNVQSDGTIDACAQRDKTTTNKITYCVLVVDDGKINASSYCTM